MGCYDQSYRDEHIVSSRQPWEVTRDEWAGDHHYYGMGQIRDQHMHVVGHLFCEAVMWLEQGLHVVRPTWQETEEGPD